MEHRKNADFISRWNCLYAYLQALKKNFMSTTVWSRIEFFRTPITDLNNNGSRIYWSQMKPTEMTNLEYQDSGIVGIEGNHRNKAYFF